MEYPGVCVYDFILIIIKRFGKSIDGNVFNTTIIFINALICAFYWLLMCILNNLRKLSDYGVSSRLAVALSRQVLALSLMMFWVAVSALRRCRLEERGKYGSFIFHDVLLST